MYHGCFVASAVLPSKRNRACQHHHLQSAPAHHRHHVASTNQYTNRVNTYTDVRSILNVRVLIVIATFRNLMFTPCTCCYWCFFLTLDAWTCAYLWRMLLATLWACASEAVACGGCVRHEDQPHLRVSSRLRRHWAKGPVSSVTEQELRET